MMGTRTFAALLDAVGLALCTAALALLLAALLVTRP